MKKIIAILVALSLTISAFAEFISIPNVPLRRGSYFSSNYSSYTATSMIEKGTWDSKTVLVNPPKTTDFDGLDVHIVRYISEMSYIEKYYSDVVVALLKTYGNVQVKCESGIDLFLLLDNGTVYCEYASLSIDDIIYGATK